MSDTSSLKDRNHYRACVTAKTRAVVIEDGKRVYVRKTLDIPGSGDIAAGSEGSVGTVLSSLVTVLHHIEEKLDRILEKMEDKESGVREIDVCDTIDISGSGISLLLSENLAEGVMMKLSIALPGFPFGRFETLGRVVRSVEMKKRDGTFFQTGIRFVDLSDDEMERLVQYTFSQQRRQIRASGGGDA